MKILYINSAGGHGGASTALLNLIKPLKDKVEIIVVFPDRGNFSKEVESIGIKCYYIPLIFNIYPPVNSLRNLILIVPHALKQVLIWIVSRVKLTRLVKEINPDIIHTNAGPVHIGYVIAKKKQIPHVWHIREYQDLDFDMHIFPSKHAYIDKLKDQINYPIAITDDIYNHFQMSGNARKIYDGVFYSNVTPKIISNKSNYFLFVGRLEKAKGVKDAVIAFVEYAQINSGCELWLVGSYSDEKYKSELYRIVKNASLFHRVKFLGFRTDVYDLMSKASALIVPSLSEGFGYITTEAMYNGCLVIGNNTAGTKIQFDNGVKVTGKEIGIRYSCHSELVEALVLVAKKESNYFFPMTERAQQTVKQLYTIERNIENIYELYKDIIK